MHGGRSWMGQVLDGVEEQSRSGVQSRARRRRKEGEEDQQDRTGLKAGGGSTE